MDQVPSIGHLTFRVEDTEPKPKAVVKKGKNPKGKSKENFLNSTKISQSHKEDLNATRIAQQHAIHNLEDEISKISGDQTQLKNLFDVAIEEASKKRKLNNDISQPQASERTIKELSERLEKTEDVISSLPETIETLNDKIKDQNDVILELRSKNNDLSKDISDTQMTHNRLTQSQILSLIHI